MEEALAEKTRLHETTQKSAICPLQPPTASAVRARCGTQRCVEPQHNAGPAIALWSIKAQSLRLEAARRLRRC